MNFSSNPSWSELVPIVEEPGDQLSISEALPLECRRLRAEVYEMLLAAARSLPTGCTLHVVEAYRTQSRQFEKWNRRLVELAREYSEEILEKLIERCKNDVADPVNRPSGHQWGTAIDVTILENGRPLDMGSDVADFSQHELIATDSPFISEEQKQNRIRLRECMEAVGFLNYKNEWWHYSYADRLWAAMKYFSSDSRDVPRSFYKYGPPVE